MVKPAYFDRNGIKRGVWSKEEDEKLSACINRFDHAKVPNWRLLPFVAGLKRCGKSCRLRWMNYLKPGLKRGNFTKDEENRIIELHKHLPNKWSAIAACFPGRTDNDIKNYWNGHIKKRRRNGAIKNDQNLHEDNEQSLDTSSCITSQNSSSSSEATFDQGLFPAENIGAVESNADSDYNAANYLCHNFLEEEFDIMSLLFESSCNSSAAKGFDFLAEPVGEDFFNLPF